MAEMTAEERAQDVVEQAVGRALWEKFDELQTLLAGFGYSRVPMVIVTALPRTVGAALLVTSTVHPTDLAALLRDTADRVEAEPATVPPGSDRVM